MKKKYYMMEWKMKVYKLESGFFGLGVVMHLKQGKEEEQYYRTLLSYFHDRPPTILANSDVYLRYMNFICSAILSICFDEYRQGKEPTEEYILEELENRELVVYDAAMQLHITVPLLKNIQFDLAASLVERYLK